MVSAVQRNLRENFEEMLENWVETIRHGGKLMFFGNGGSASDAQHLASILRQGR